MTSEKRCIVFKNIIRICLTEYGLIYNHSGDYSRKVPPVPIPNTEVKLSYAESTCRDTDREDRASPLSSSWPSCEFSHDSVFSYLSPINLPFLSSILLTFAWPFLFLHSLLRLSKKSAARFIRAAFVMKSVQRKNFFVICMQNFFQEDYFVGI